MHQPIPLRFNQVIVSFHGVIQMEISNTGQVNRYIATQGPMQNTCIDFCQVSRMLNVMTLACSLSQSLLSLSLSLPLSLSPSQMVWEQDCSLIVMLTETIERKKVREVYIVKMTLVSFMALDLLFIPLFPSSLSFIRVGCLLSLLA